MVAAYGTPVGLGVIVAVRREVGVSITYGVSVGYVVKVGRRVRDGRGGTVGGDVQVGSRARGVHVGGGWVTVGVSGGKKFASE
jgi:hypothetical protein